MRGEILRGFIVNCAICNCLEVISKTYRDLNKNEAEKKLRHDNWSKTVQLGWVCPNCRSKENEQ